MKRHTNNVTAWNIGIEYRSGVFGLRSVPWLVLWRNLCYIVSIIPNRALKLRICTILTISRTIARDRSNHYFWRNITASRSPVKRIGFREWQKQWWFATLFQYGLWIIDISNCTSYSRAYSRNRKWLGMQPISRKTLAAGNFFWRRSWTWHCCWFANFLSSSIIATPTIPFWFCASLLLIWTYQAMKCIDQVFLGGFLNIFWRWFTPPCRHIECERICGVLVYRQLPNWTINIPWPSEGRYMHDFHLTSCSTIIFHNALAMNVQTIQSIRDRVEHLSASKAEIHKQISLEPEIVNWTLTTCHKHFLRTNAVKESGSHRCWQHNLFLQI